MKHKSGLWKKLLLGAFCFLFLIIAIIFVVFNGPLRTIMSIQKISDAPAYEMTYCGDYAMDEYLENGASTENELTDFLLGHLGYGAGRFLNIGRACSAFFAQTPDGDLIFARNFDTGIHIGGVVKTDAAEGGRIIAMSNFGWILNKPREPLTFNDKARLLGAPYVITDGINEYGLAAAFLTADGSRSAIDQSKVTLYDTTVTGVILSKAKTVEEAVALLSSHNVKLLSDYPSQFMVADAGGNAAIIEYVGGDMKVLYKEGDYQVCSNFILYDNPRLTGFGSDRYMNIESALAQSDGVISVEDALALLQGNTIPKLPAWSVVYNLTDKTAYVTYYGHYDTVCEYSF